MWRFNSVITMIISLENSNLLYVIPSKSRGPKTDGDVPLVAESWTQKNRGKRGILGKKDRIL